MVTALTVDRDEDVESEVEAEIEQNANKEIIDIEPEEVEQMEETKDVVEEREQMTLEGPGF